MRNPFALYGKHRGRGKLEGHSPTVIDHVPVGHAKEAVLLTTLTLEKPSPLLPLAMLLCWSILLARVFALQIVESSTYRLQAEGNRTKTEITKSLRGVMYDADGNLLVKNVPNFSLMLNAVLLRQYHSSNQDVVLQRIADAAHMDIRELQKMYETSSISGQPIVVRDHIPYTEALQLMTGLDDLTGVTVEILYAREYLTDPSWSHVLGYMGNISEEEYAEAEPKSYQLTDDVGKTGVEQSWESVLHGRDGIRQLEVDAQGREKSILATTEPVAGNNIYLTVRHDLQTQLTKLLADVVTERNLPGAAAVALDPRNGNILALVSIPNFDNNAFTGGIASDAFAQLLDDPHTPLFHRAISGEYPSGSTVKPVIAAAALEENIITERTTVQSTGGIRIEQFFFPDWKAGGHGTTNVIKGLAESVNTFFYFAGGGDNTTTTGLGVLRITQYAKKFGLGAPTGIDLPGEATGFLPTPTWKEEFKNEPWYIGDTYHLAIGQGDILVTPLQVAYYTSIIANRGDGFRPHLVSKVTDGEGTMVQVYEPVLQTHDIVKKENLAIVAAGMRAAVTSGSARSLQNLPVTAAGKTGTAQFGAEKKTHSWFTVFAPYENPEIVLSVIVEEGGEGNDAALPVARTLLASYFAGRAGLTEQP